MTEEPDRLTDNAPPSVNRKLSEQQAAFLKHLLESYRRFEAAAEHHASKFGLTFPQRNLEAWGIQFEPDTGFTRSESASFSRMLRRLEARGLIELGNHVAGGRSGQPGVDDDDRPLKQFRMTHVKFTAKGRTLAERLTDNAAQ